MAPTAPLAAPGADAHARTVLLVDDDDAVATAVARQLRARGFTVQVAGGGSEALAMLDALPECSVVVSDFEMPAMHGVDLLAEVACRRPDLRRAMMTGRPNAPEVQEAAAAGIVERLICKGSARLCQDLDELCASPRRPMRSDRVPRSGSPPQ
jgi:DNA-binding NtrC family response regulator